MRQGPHHSAQKSTTTAPFDFKTSASKVASVTLPTAMGLPLGVAVRARARSREGLERRYRFPERQAAARSTAGQVCHLLIQDFGRKFHQLRHRSPDKGGANRPVHINFPKHSPVERELTQISLWHIITGAGRWL